MFTTLLPLKFSFPEHIAKMPSNYLQTTVYQQDYNQHLCIGELSAIHFWERSKTMEHFSENFKQWQTEEQVSPSTRFNLIMLSLHGSLYATVECLRCRICTGIQTRIFGEAILQKDYKPGPSYLHLQKQWKYKDRWERKIITKETEISVQTVPQLKNFLLEVQTAKFTPVRRSTKAK